MKKINSSTNRIAVYLIFWQSLSCNEDRKQDGDQGGTLYIYGDTPATPGPRLPALSGVLIDVTTVKLGKNSSYGPRDYLDFYLAAPMPNSRVLLRLSSKTVAELTSLDGKKTLTAEIIDDARQSLDEAQRKGLLNMHFSAFVIQ